MSFAIAAIYKNRDIYIATDSQMTNKFTRQVSHNANKVAEISKAVGIAYTGTVAFGECIIAALTDDYAKQGYIPLLQSDIASDVVTYIKNLMPQWIDEHLNIVPEAAFIVVCLINLESRLIILHQKVATPYNKGWKAGDYRFSVAVPEDIRVDDCIQLCTQFLSRPDNCEQAPEATLGKLVELISEHSDAVDNRPKIWKAGQDYWSTQITPI